MKNNFLNRFYKIYISILAVLASVCVTLLSIMFFMAFGFVGATSLALWGLFIAVATPIIAVFGLIKFNKNYDSNEPLSNFRKFFMLPVTLIGLILSISLPLYFVFFW